jgi:hypothetical protein
MACRIPAVGFVTVSLRKSTTGWLIVFVTPLNDHRALACRRCADILNPPVDISQHFVDEFWQGSSVSRQLPALSAGRDRIASVPRFHKIGRLPTMKGPAKGITMKKTLASHASEEARTKSQWNRCR